MIICYQARLDGCVDKQGSRKGINHLFNITNAKVCIYSDSGNGALEKFGQTVVGLKQEGNIILPTIADPKFDPNMSILNDTEDLSKAFYGSCGEVVASNPQHQLTNIIASDLKIFHTMDILTQKCINYHTSFFDIDQNACFSE